MEKLLVFYSDGLDSYGETLLSKIKIIISDILSKTEIRYVLVEKSSRLPAAYSAAISKDEIAGCLFIFSGVECKGAMKKIYRAVDKIARCPLSVLLFKEYAMVDDLVEFPDEEVLPIDILSPSDFEIEVRDAVAVFLGGMVY